MQNNLLKTVKATISSIIVALLITGLIIFGITLFFGQKIEEIILLANKVSITTDKKTDNIETSIDEEQNILINYPEYRDSIWYINYK